MEKEFPKIAEIEYEKSDMFENILQCSVESPSSVKSIAISKNENENNNRDFFNINRPIWRKCS